jgi:hypothetical protein
MWSPTAGLREFAFEGTSLRIRCEKDDWQLVEPDG